MTAREKALRIAYFSAAPLISLAAFSQVFGTWFQNDDFGWLGLRYTAAEKGLTYALFHPLAQGTVRVFSERIPFLALPAGFGITPIPFRILSVVTLFGALTLTALIGTRLTGSRAAGLLAAIFWGVNANLTRPLAWAADFNSILCAACVLTAFYARLRGWRLAEWIAYLLGFGVLEVIVVYPAVATLHSLCLDRKRLRSALPLFIPAAIFSAIHAFFIPNTGGDEYRIAIDARIFATLFEYLRLSTGPVQLYQFIGEYRRSGIAASIAIGAALAIFTLWRILRRDFLPLVCWGWFLLFLGPLLVLPKHVMEYSLATPLIGISWLGAWGVVRGWRANRGTRVLAAAVAAIYVIPTFYEARLYTAWWRDRSLPLRAVVESVRKGLRAHPGTAFIVQGVDNEVFNTGFDDNPFRLFNAVVYLAPGSEKQIPLIRENPNDQIYVISARDAYEMLEHGKARALTLSGTAAPDTTAIYKAVLSLDPTVTRRNYVDVADARFASQVGSGWYTPEQSLRWMGKSATLRIGGPVSPSEKLKVTGYAPEALLGGGPIRLTFSAGGIAIGTATVAKPDAFSFEFQLPSSLAGRDEIELKVETSRTFHPPNDERELGMAFGTFAIR